MHFISTKNLDTDTIKSLFIKIDKINDFNDNNSNNNSNNYYKNKILVNAFFEPSTRTSLSFESSMYRLGGKVINFNTDTSSINKGESFEDTIRTLSYYGDILVLRHPNIEMIEKASNICNIPIINAGNGNGEHPTQALIDLYTIYKKFGNDFSSKRILFIGDILNSRTIHSLLNLLHLYQNIKIYLLPFSNCEPNIEMLTDISKNHNQDIYDIIKNYNDLNPNDYDIVYCSRLQKERININNINNKNKAKTDLIIDNEFANKMKDNSIILHPLPRNNELDEDLDNNPRSFFFKQVEYSLNVRMTLIDILIRSNFELFKDK
jgi:carbamoyl-phosphate synthase / aspartate carbamoyltransferase